VKNRTELAKYFTTLGFKVGAEVGVFAGEYSLRLCQIIPGLQLFCIDPWKNMPDRYAETQRKLAPYTTLIIRQKSLDAAETFANETLDFVYIDGEHSYESVKEDIEAWTPKVRKGGIVSGHDYYYTRAGNIGVILAVNQYIKEHGYKLELTDWDIADMEPERTHHYKINDEQQPSWWFMK